MGVRQDNSTGYVHNDEPNLLNIHKALEYNGQGQPILRVSQANSSPTSNSAFGENINVPITPIIQLDALYGFDPREFQQFSQFGGDSETTGTLFKVHTGTNPYGYGVLRSNRILRYRPGQGAMARFTAAFENPQLGVTLRAGLFAQEQGLNVGYDSVTNKFGILRQNGGKAHIAKFTVTAAGNETLTITLNDIPYSVTVTSDDATGTAAQIAATPFAGWTVEQCDDTVSFLSQSVGLLTGSFSYTSTGTSTGVYTETQAGAAHTLNWTYQEDWNIDSMDGNGPSGINMDWSKLNIFQVNFRWLGAGEIRWAIENPNTGDMMFIHHEHYSNRNTDVHLDNPSFKIGYIAANLSANTVTDAHVSGASMMAAIEGLIVDNSFTNSATSGTQTSLSQNNLHNLISIKNTLIYQDKINLRELKLKTLSVSSQNNDPIEIYLILNGTLSDPEEYLKNGNFSSVNKAITEGTFDPANEQPLVILINGINGTSTFDLSQYNVTLPPNNRVAIAVQSSQTIQSINASLTWGET